MTKQQECRTINHGFEDADSCELDVPANRTHLIANTKTIRRHHVGTDSIEQRFNRTVVTTATNQLERERVNEGYNRSIKCVCIGSGCAAVFF